MLANSHRWHKIHERVRNTLSSHVINWVDMLDLYVKQNVRVRVGVRIGVEVGVRVGLGLGLALGLELGLGLGFRLD